MAKFEFEEEFRLDHPETIGEKDSHFDLSNYKDWLEKRLIESRFEISRLKTIIENDSDFD